MSLGTYISGTGHAALVVWMVVGWGTQSDPLPFEVTEVALISTEEFATLTQGVQPDRPVSEPVVPPAPEIEQPAPVPRPVVEPPRETPPPPEPIAAPVTETPPEAPDLTAPETVVADTPPDVPDTPTIVAPPPSTAVGTSLRPVLRPAPRVAPEIVAPPPPDAAIAPQVQTATDQSDSPAEAEPDPVEESTAPEAATDRIITEAAEPSFAPEVSLRPASRPARVAAAATQTPPETDTAAVDSALAAALAATPPEPVAGLSGGQLSEGDKSGFLRQIGNCWNTGSLSTGAQNTIIIMGFDMTPDGRPVSGSVRLNSFTGGTSADAEAAFATARRALIRCTDEGYNLPRDQYELWQRVELTVDPTQMRQR